MDRRIAALAPFLALCACGRPANEPPEAPAPVSTQPAPVDYSGDINVIGTEPFWAVDIRADTLKLQRPSDGGNVNLSGLTVEGSLTIDVGGEVMTVTAAHSGPQVTDEGATWSGGGMIVNLRQETCSDGMSDRVYPLSARVVFNNETLNGCAYPAGMDLGPPP